MHRICVFGAGAIGGHLTVRLARGGSDVSIVARGEHLAAIRERGLTVRAFDGEHHARPRASADPAELGPQDAVIVTTKQTALASVAAAIAPLLGPETIVAFVMNGIPWWYFHRHGGDLDGLRLPTLDRDDFILNSIGVERTLGGIVHSPSTVIQPGVVSTVGERHSLIFGELDGRITERGNALAAAIAADGVFTSRLTPDIRTEVWGKLLGNISGGPLCILSRSNSRTTYADPAARDAAKRMMREAMAIAAALGRPLDIDVDQRFAGAGGSDHKLSILQDLELGRPMEIDGQFLVPLDLARRAGVPTPTLDLLVGLARQAASAAGLYPS